VEEEGDEVREGGGRDVVEVSESLRWVEWAR